MKRLSAVALSAFVYGCSGLFPCENTVVSEAMRPGGPYRAVVFLRDCGATTTWSTHVSILGIKRFSNSEVGNVFVGEGGQPSSPGVAVRWVDRDTLEVSYEPSIQVFHSKTTWEAIGIVFAPPPWTTDRSCRSVPPSSQCLPPNKALQLTGLRLTGTW